MPGTNNNRRVPTNSRVPNRRIPTRSAATIGDAEEAGIGVLSEQETEEVLRNVEEPPDPIEDLSTLTDREEGSLEAATDMDKINPETDYLPPVDDGEKGQLQLLYENQHEVPPQSKVQFVLMLAMAELNFTLEHFEPYCTYLENTKKKKKEKTIAPKKDLYVKEVKRRNPNNNLKANSWKISKWQEELAGTGLMDQRDKDWVRYMERKTRKEIHSYLTGTKKNSESQNNSTVTVSIQMTKNERMRLICCLESDDEILAAYKRTQMVLTREQLDGRNSDALPPSFYALAAAKCNDEEWVAVSRAIPDLHSDFAVAKEWPKREEYNFDQQKIKKIVQWEKSKILVMCKRYNLSGNGSDNKHGTYDEDETPQMMKVVDDSGNTVHEDEEINTKWGHFNLDLAMTEGGDDRSDYLKGQPTDLLYWWDTLDSLGILQMACVMFNTDLAATSDQRPSRIVGNKKQKTGPTESDKSISDIAKTLDRMVNSKEKQTNHKAKAGLRKELRQLKVQKMKYELKLEDCQPDSGKYKIYQERIKDVAASIEQIEQEIDD